MLDGARRPTRLARRTWSTYNIAALWIGMSVVITTYTLASGMMQTFGLSFVLYLVITGKVRK